MRILLITTQEHHYEYLTQLGIDTYHILHYGDPLKAMDNLQELKPNILIVSAHDFPRHWKPLHVLLRDVSPDALFFLIIDAPLHSTEKRKADSMGISGYLTPADCVGYDGKAARGLLLQAAGEPRELPGQKIESPEPEMPSSGILEIPPSVELTPCTIYIQSRGHARIVPSIPLSHSASELMGLQIFITASFEDVVRTLPASVVQCRDKSEIQVQLIEYCS